MQINYLSTCLTGKVDLGDSSARAAEEIPAHPDVGAYMHKVNPNIFWYFL